MVAIQVLSDLHLENPKAYDIFDIPANAPYLALLGDIGYASKHQAEYLEFLRLQLAQFQVVFLVLGNHEPWHSDWDSARKLMREFEQMIRLERESRPGAKNGVEQQGLGEFVLLDRTRYDLPERGAGGEAITILGCTLFSHVPAASSEAVSFGVNDFYHIDGWTVEQHSARFATELAWLNEQVAALRGEGRKAVVLTHYSPTMDDRAVDPRHRSSPIQTGFATDLKDQLCWTSEVVKVWAFGHTHFNCDFVDEKSRKRVMANQRGYYFGQSDAVEIGKVIEL
ncbi:Uu.00g004040.m01.CDS01 [Anthostomella pinea]|uniref:Uu.00g004040.m01.CDS01 n=1 Tax=Anthostomella pinea TaxID=933095 RepID=A0AAI8VJX2_9PEZI|nr:Uu.00g004040.m01.CDS01 [Anthostomella pinea]